MLERVETLPGVRAGVGLAIDADPHPGNARALVMAERRADTIEDSAAFTNIVTPDYFETMGIRVLRGRGVHASSIRDELAARRGRQRDDGEVLGRRSRSARHDLAFRGDPKDLITIVGVVAGHLPDESSRCAAADGLHAVRAGRTPTVGP